MSLAMRRAAPNAAPQPQFLACVADEVTRESVTRAAAQLGWAQARVKEGGVGAACALLEGGDEPALLLVDLADAADPIEALQPLADVCPPETKVLVIGTLNDVALYRRLVALGITDYLVKPISSDAMREALARSSQPVETAAPAAQRQARIVAVLGTRGGVGTTTVAAALGWSMANDLGLKAALVDFDLQFGSMALNFDIEPGRGLSEALQHPERIDPLLVASAMAPLGERLRVLAAEEPLEAEMQLEPDAIEPLLAALATDFDLVVADLPRRLDLAARRLLGAATGIVLVTDLSLAGMRDGHRLIGLAKALRPETRPIVVVNRSGSHPREVARAEFERGLGVAVDVMLPFEAKAAVALAESAKALTEAAPGSKSAAGLRQLAIRLAGREPEAKPSLLKRFFK